MDNKKKLTEKQQEDLRRYHGGDYEDYTSDYRAQGVSDAFNPSYDASEDIPSEYKGKTIDERYDKYADANPVHGNWLRLKRMIGRTLSGGKEK